jgi:hypothetical protein
MSELHEITSGLGSAYDQWKTYEKEKNAFKDRFFKAADEAQETLAQIVEVFTAASEAEALEQAQRYFPRYRVVEVVQREENRWGVALEERPDFQNFTFINKDDGRVYSRYVAEGSPTLDDDRIKDENPELWEKITEVPTERVLKPLETLTAEELAEIEPYIYKAKPTARLAAPRKAKPEELDENND